MHCSHTFYVLPKSIFQQARLTITFVPRDIRVKQDKGTAFSRSSFFFIAYVGSDKIERGILIPNTNHILSERTHV